MSAGAQLQSRMSLPCLGASPSSSLFFRLLVLGAFLFTQFFTTSSFISLTVFSSSRFLKMHHQRRIKGRINRSSSQSQGRTEDSDSPESHVTVSSSVRPIFSLMISDPKARRTGLAGAPIPSPSRSSSHRASRSLARESALTGSPSDFHFLSDPQKAGRSPRIAVEICVCGRWLPSQMQGFSAFTLNSYAPLCSILGANCQWQKKIQVFQEALDRRG